jgi:hypothetical protein
MVISTVVPMITDLILAPPNYATYPEDVTVAEIMQSLMLSLCYFFDSIAFLLFGFLVYRYGC